VRFTALFAGTVGIFQNDLKRVIAYSTCSQLGYMVLHVVYLIIRWPYFIC
jgi:NADH:ubiquinone oxidoreductase subunit 5 (subunit L)/multisubunit Na+/H+ antiporter MnhA subunit